MKIRKTVDIELGLPLLLVRLLLALQLVRGLVIWLARWVDSKGNYIFVFSNKLAHLLGLKLLEF